MCLCDVNFSNIAILLGGTWPHQLIGMRKLPAELLTVRIKLFVLSGLGATTLVGQARQKM